MSGLAFPKPEKRQPKPRKPIQRSGQPSRVRRTPAGRAKASLNALWSKVILSMSTFCMVPPIPGVTCLMWANDPAHLYPKSTHPSIRHHVRNGIPACRPCHTFLDTHADFREALAQRLDPKLKAEAAKPSPDRAEVRATLTAALKQYRRAA